MVQKCFSRNEVLAYRTAMPELFSEQFQEIATWTLAVLGLLAAPKIRSVHI